MAGDYLGGADLSGRRAAGRNRLSQLMSLAVSNLFQADVSSMNSWFPKSGGKKYPVFPPDLSGGHGFSHLFRKPGKTGGISYRRAEKREKFPEKSRALRPGLSWSCGDFGDRLL